ncbi:MAG TPA: DUF5606 domain-containing protein [Chitinophagaceae bacterium]|nr:DUF5606 domain-containing protein [Chitinophagaceae bacterium]
MEYNKIIAVTGLPGLYELVSSKGDGAIVRSLDDKSTKFISSRIHNFSSLESIEIFTVRDNVNLVDVYAAMDKSKESLPDGKDNEALKKYFEKVYPDLDFNRVYSSDMKKIVKWYSILKANNIEIKLPEESGEEIAPPVVKEAAKEEKPEKIVKTKEPAKAKEKTKTQETAKVKETTKSKEKGKGSEKKTSQTTAKKKSTK